ncbi:phospholipase D family protein [Photobacterium minamisatsumaniensis]|uniref:phospholipase D family protein n=1 Tax=Photobacterium minamisatsumaniensis TaxID=2910233 RepID=UPI003D10C4EF
MGSKFKVFIVLLFVLTIGALLGCNKPTASLKTVSQSIPFNKDTELASQALPYLKANPELTGFYPLVDGQEALWARLALIDSAQQSIDLQYYIYSDDNTSSLLTYTLYQAAERGVRVRLLLDDMQSRNDKILASLSRHPNIEVRLFNAFHQRFFRIFGLKDFDRLNRRMHNKALIADGAFAITGGRNIGDEYFSANGSIDFGDFDILTLGPIVPDISAQFDLYWNSEPASPIESIIKNIGPLSPSDVVRWEHALKAAFKGSDYIEKFSDSPLAQHVKNQTINFHWGEARLYYDLPSKVYAPDETNLMLHELGETLKNVNSKLLLISPYFVPTEVGTASLIKAAEQGIEITIITNSLASNDVFAVHGWYAKYRKDLLAAGIKLYEVKVDPSLKKKRSWLGSSRTSLHAKTFIMDNRKIFVGSSNLDPRSAYLNTEMGVLIDAPGFTRLLYRGFESALKKGTYRLSLNQSNDIVWHNDLSGRSFDSEPDASIWLRIGAWMAGVLPIEDQL